MLRFRLLEIEKGQLNKSNLDNINPCYFEVLQGHDLVVYQLYMDLQAFTRFSGKLMRVTHGSCFSLIPYTNMHCWQVLYRSYVLVYIHVCI